jgi:hypothetical protein
MAVKTRCESRFSAFTAYVFPRTLVLSQTRPVSAPVHHQCAASLDMHIQRGATRSAPQGRQAAHAIRCDCLYLQTIVCCAGRENNWRVSLEPASQPERALRQALTFCRETDFRGEGRSIINGQQAVLMTARSSNMRSVVEQPRRVKAARGSANRQSRSRAQEKNSYGLLLLALRPPCDLSLPAPTAPVTVLPAH